jgi:hypothetical protein
MTSEECLRHALECDMLAASARSESKRVAMMASANLWRTLAEMPSPDDKRREPRMDEVADD